MKWRDVTNTFSEDRRHWRNTYLEVCEVIDDKIECSLFSCEDDLWEIYFSMGWAYGVSYAPASEARAKRESMMKDMEEEYAKNGDNPTDEFVDMFDKKYGLDVMHSFF